MASQKTNSRLVAVNVLQRLLQQQGSLASELPALTKVLDEQEKRFAHELCYGTCRWYFWLEKRVQQFVQKPLKSKDSDIKVVLLLGLYQLTFTRVAAHAAINESVNLAPLLSKPWAKKLINGVLRSFQREYLTIDEQGNHHITAQNDKHDKLHRQTHPQWLQQSIKEAWPAQATDIFFANNQHPPFTLRVNQQHYQRDSYQSLLQQSLDDITPSPTPFSSVGVLLSSAQDVKQLPGFDKGAVSVQDEAAQLAAELLLLEPQQRVLDACCAPGGKTCHIGEQQPQLKQLIALDVEERRLGRVHDNIARLSIDAEVICADGTQPDTWWDGQSFDRILLDAPCSATGVIRRHPDIKILREPSAITELVQLQLRLLQALWPLLAEGGILLYATCSILPQENTQLIEQFIQQHSDVKHDEIKAPWGEPQVYGRQLLPQVDGHDGFYYARLMKMPA